MAFDLSSCPDGHRGDAVMLTVDVAGVPQPQGSKSAYKRGKRIVVVEDNVKLHPWRDTVANTLLAHRLREAWPTSFGAVQVDLVFRFPRIKAHFGTGRNAETLKESAPYWHTGTPDADKLTRGVFDALTISGVIRDDSLIASHKVTKRYVWPSEVPGVQIIVGRLASP